MYIPLRTLEPFQELCKHIDHLQQTYVFTQPLEVAQSLFPY